MRRLPVESQDQDDSRPLPAVTSQYWSYVKAHVTNVTRPDEKVHVAHGNGLDETQKVFVALVNGSNKNALMATNDSVLLASPKRSEKTHVKRGDGNASVTQLNRSSDGKVYVPQY